MAARLWAAGFQFLLFFLATGWGFGIGHEIDGAWLGMLMGLNAGVFAVLMVGGLLDLGRRRLGWRL